MCLHTTHLLFTCNHILELPIIGKGHIPPKYCDRIKGELDWYHGQPQRTPEPDPVPAPKPCPLVFGTSTLSGNTQFLFQKHPCAECITAHGLAGINAIDARRQKQEEPSRSRKRKGNRTNKQTTKRWVWKSVSGEGWKGLMKVRSHSSAKARSSTPSPTLSKGELSFLSENEALLSPTPHIPQPLQTPSMPGVTPTSAPPPVIVLPPESEQQTAAENFALLNEAGLRGMQMFEGYPDNRLAMPQGTFDPRVLLAPGTAPIFPLSSAGYGMKGPMLIPVSNFYPPPPMLQLSEPALYKVRQPVQFLDGTVELPDDEESHREAVAGETPPQAQARLIATAQSNVIGSENALESTLKNLTYTSMYGPSRHAASLRPINRLLAQLKKEEQVKPRRHSDTPAEDSGTSASPIIRRAMSVGPDDEAGRW